MGARNPLRVKARAARVGHVRPHGRRLRRIGGPDGRRLSASRRDLLARRRARMSAGARDRGGRQQHRLRRVLPEPGLAAEALALAPHRDAPCAGVRSVSPRVTALWGEVRRGAPGAEPVTMSEGPIGGTHATPTPPRSAGGGAQWPPRGPPEPPRIDPQAPELLRRGWPPAAAGVAAPAGGVGVARGPPDVVRGSTAAAAPSPPPTAGPGTAPRWVADRRPRRRARCCHWRSSRGHRRLAWGAVGGGCGGGR